MKSEFIKSVISNTKNDDLLNKDLEACRLLCVVAAILIPGFWFIHKLTNPDIIDFLAARLIACSLCIFLCFYLNNFIKNNIIFSRCFTLYYKYLDYLS